MAVRLAMLTDRVVGPMVLNALMIASAAAGPVTSSSIAPIAEKFAPEPAEVEKSLKGTIRSAVGFAPAVVGIATSRVERFAPLWTRMINRVPASPPIWKRNALAVPADVKSRLLRPLGLRLGLPSVPS